ncbi:hypothetical protein DL98DRAFT_595887 [Cadophora sp. DSE1049]|nr:hypothetical protein DL98DRAFT_595887 [Cadophora sp. DSE1049]
MFKPFCSNWPSRYTELPFCSSKRPTYWKPFAKWKNGIYEELFTMVRSNYAEGNRTHFAGSEKLGMSQVADEASPWYGNTPVPRMLQNQLNYQLELKMAELDEKIMKSAMAIMKKAERTQ